jgi:ribosome-associated protein
MSGGDGSPACGPGTLLCDRYFRGETSHLTPLEQARRIADLAQDKLAREVLILDMRPACSYTDFFVIATGQNPRQTKAIYDEVRERLKHEERVVPARVTGADSGTWILADYLDVIFHVFTPEARNYYRLEELWGDVPSVEVAATA